MRAERVRHRRTISSFTSCRLTTRLNSSRACGRGQGARTAWRPSRTPLILSRHSRANLPLGEADKNQMLTHTMVRRGTHAKIRAPQGNGCLAQLVERRPYKANVGGSIPSAPTIQVARRWRSAVRSRNAPRRVTLHRGIGASVVPPPASDSASSEID